MRLPPSTEAEAVLAAETVERATFERLANRNTRIGLARSRRGTYVNPPTARDWKWFQLGAIFGRQRAADAEIDRQDAERYRWLRDKSEPGICAFYLSVGKAFDGVKFTQATVDAAIDAQITASTKDSTP